MSFTENHVKKVAREGQSRAAKRAFAEQESANVALRIFKALTDLDEKVVYEVAKKPELLESFVDKDGPGNFKSPYVMHAFVLLMDLADVKHEAVLETMSTENIELLKKMLLMSQERPCPDKKMLESSLSARTQLPHAVDPIQARNNEALTLSLQATMDVADYWTCVKASLDKWVKTIDTFASKKQAETIAPTEKYISLQELADVMGYKNVGSLATKKNLLIKAHPELADEINSMFVARGRIKVFKQECLERFNQLCRPRSGAVTAKKTEAATAEKKAPATQTKGRKKTLVDFKAFEAFTAALAATAKAAQDELATKNQEYQAKLDAVCAVKESDKRVELLQQMTAANDAVVKADEAYRQMDAKHKQALKLLADIKSAQAAMLKFMNENTIESK